MLSLLGPFVPYIGGGLAIMMLALGGYACNLRERVKAKDERIYALEMANASWDRKVEDQEANIKRLKFALDSCNQSIEDMADQGMDALDNQRKVDELYGRLARAEDDLRIISDKYVEMREEMKHLDLCQTYEMVLRSLAGGVGP